jgi:hypothetical protein
MAEPRQASRVTDRAAVGSTAVVSASREGPPRLRRLRAALPALGAAGALAVAGGLTAALAPREGGVLAVLILPAALLGGFGALRGRTWPATSAVGALGAGYCIAVESTAVDVVATSIVAVVLFLSFQLAAGSSGLASRRSPTSLALVALAGSAGPIVLVLARGVGGVPPHLFLPALAAGVAAVVAPVLVASRRMRAPEADEPPPGADPDL